MDEQGDGRGIIIPTNPRSYSSTLRLDLADSYRVRDSEMSQRAREPESQRAREPESQRAREPESQRAREPETGFRYLDIPVNIKPNADDLVSQEEKRREEKRREEKMDRNPHTRIKDISELSYEKDVRLE
ncbi:hypothetical protein EAF00_006478 [Botryotinia globosa]|nr:hypothetical protein EAF00_006478 [Botryotinia globosa]